MLYMVLRHVSWRIRMYSLFREIFKYRENISNNRFREIHKSSLKIAIMFCHQLVEEETAEDAVSTQSFVLLSHFLAVLHMSIII